jgi:cytochrome c peroxidase
MRKNWGIIFFFIAWVALIQCKPEPLPDGGSLTHIPYQPKPYKIPTPLGYPSMEIPADNPMTQEGVYLGRMLFFDPILSRDSSLSCASCHRPELAFTDGRATSPGVDGLFGRRSAMSLVDIGYVTTGLFWNGSVNTLEEQALLPIEDPLEMHALWPDIAIRLQNHPDYPQRFRKAFGIEKKSQIDKFLAAKAIAQFERSIVSKDGSRYDRLMRQTGNGFATEEEENGRIMFFFESSGFTGLDLVDAECGHCHGGVRLTGDEFLNNGIQPSAGPLQFGDLGLGEFTGRDKDMGKFRTPTLRNIAVTAPYMHDGRFQTLEEVIDHYNAGGHPSFGKDPLLIPLGMSEQNKKDLLAFLRALTDSLTLTAPEYQNPFL